MDLRLYCVAGLSMVKAHEGVRKFPTLSFRKRDCMYLVLSPSTQCSTWHRGAARLELGERKGATRVGRMNAHDRCGTGEEGQWEGSQSVL